MSPSTGKNLRTLHGESAADDGHLFPAVLRIRMADGGRIGEFIRRRARNAGRRYEEARRAYREAHDEALTDGLPVDEAGRSRIVCRRFAERRAVRIDDAARPACFEEGHADCHGCREDIRRGGIETW